MRRGLLSDHFAAIAAKKLAEVDANPEASNQHEVTGSNELRILGDTQRMLHKGGPDNRFFGTYIWLGGEQEALTEEGRLSWYDPRRNDPTRTAEWRLYYQSNAVTDIMRPGDTLFVARRPDDHLFFIVTPDGSTVQAQLLWLFGLSEQPSLDFQQKEIRAAGAAELDFAARYILDELGIDAEEPEAEYLDRLIKPFRGKFPPTRKFSKAARDSLNGVSSLGTPDAALLAWMEREEMMFRRLERHIVAERITSGFSSSDGADVEGFIGFSLSVQNRRKSRAGLALENHLEAIFAENGIEYARGARTENKNRPDFLFPGELEYHDEAFAPQRLTMLGAKSSIKDRWRQVLSEATRIDRKHLLTLVPGISEGQTDEMEAKGLQLVVPGPLHTSFKPAQQAWLMDLKEFLALVRERQSA